MIVDKREVRYHEDASALFAHLGGLDAQDSVLLESSDIESKKNTMCVAVLTAAVRVTCTGQQVVAEALSDTGQAIVDRLRGQLPDYLTHDDGSTVTFSFSLSELHDERKRLQAPSTAEVLRALQLDAGYKGSNLPFLGGGFAFDYLETFEKLSTVREGLNTYPDFQFLVAETYLLIDHLSRTAEVEAVGVDGQALTTRLDDLVEQIAAAPTTYEEPTPTADEPLRVLATVTDAEFRDQVKALKGNIYDGDIYQVVPARAFEMTCDDAFAAYRRLRSTNPSPYMFYVRGLAAGKTYELIGASPESNLKFDAATREVQLYPIAGTRPRGLNPDGSINHELDIRAELDMRTDAKEIAEHTMLVDLARNDLARVAVPATRRVADLLQVDRYSRVMHLVSRVTATLDPDFDALDAYRACMNMGTLTGAPKLRAMELLRGVEQTRRGSYGGAVGYLRGDGSMDTCIVIRSAFIQDGKAIVQAGAGVVRDSSPQSEADETLHKAYAVINAIALAQGTTPEVIR
ncbi:anthranilate synthase component 1 [Corynebacterium sp. SCR221107]|nr:anthranilate synthase component 1 [Corynebacterium sp. SCR221107]WBT08757.1 anthranilate synthase component 1 [Corynebacterium sp. SCR221107]